MLNALISRWNTELVAFLGRCGNSDVFGFNRLVSEVLRADESRLSGMLNTIGLPRRVPSLVSKLVNDIEDERLPLTIETTPSPLDANAAVCWIIDTHDIEFWVDEGHRLTASEALWIEQTTDYTVDESGTFAYYTGPDRYAVATLAPRSLMAWAEKFLANQKALLIETLECSRESKVFHDAADLLSNCARQGSAEPRSRYDASRPFSAALMPHAAAS